MSVANTINEIVIEIIIIIKPFIDIDREIPKCSFFSFKIFIISLPSGVGGLMRGQSTNTNCHNTQPNNYHRKIKMHFLHFESTTWNFAPLCIKIKLIRISTPYKQVRIRQKWSTSNNPLACTEGAYCGFKMCSSWKCPDHYQFWHMEVLFLSDFQLELPAPYAVSY